MAKTVKVRVLVAFDEEGHFEVDDEWLGGKSKGDETRLKRLRDWCKLPYSCFVDIELPIPERLEGEVVKMQRVKT